MCSFSFGQPGKAGLLHAGTCNSTSREGRMAGTSIPNEVASLTIGDTCLVDVGELNVRVPSCLNPSARICRSRSYSTCVRPWGLVTRSAFSGIATKGWCVVEPKQSLLTLNFVNYRAAVCLNPS